MISSYRCPSTPVVRVSFRSALLAAAVAAATVVVCTLPAEAWAADDAAMQRMATCKDSWHEWNEADPRMKQYLGIVESRLTPADGAAFTPKASMTAFGLPVSAVFPESIGTGVGFSMMISGDFAQIRKVFEQQLGAPLTCSTSDGTLACQREIGPKRTVILMTEGPRSKSTLAGCYYFYQK